MSLELIKNLSPDLPVIIAGPTAGGKSALALAIAETQGGQVINADALQVWSDWRLLSARPSKAEEDRAPHRLYGHLRRGSDWSVGHWLRQIEPILAEKTRPIIVGGTGLYLTALTEGLAEIPPIPDAVRREADVRRLAGDVLGMLAEIDPDTRARIDNRNPMRIQRAWEVQRATGKGLVQWQSETGPALLPRARAQCLVLNANRDWLAERIDRRFRQMIALGALEEARAALPHWQPEALWAKAIGAPELIAHLKGETDLETAITCAQAASRQYAKRQRTWFRARMRSWQQLSAEDLS